MKGGLAKLGQMGRFSPVITIRWALFDRAVVEVGDRPFQRQVFGRGEPLRG